MELGRKGKMRAVMFDSLLLLPPSELAREGIRRVVFRGKQEAKPPMLYTNRLVSDASAAAAEGGLPRGKQNLATLRVPARSAHSLAGPSGASGKDIDCSTCRHCASIGGTGSREPVCLAAWGPAEGPAPVASMEKCPLILARCPFLLQESHSS
jgi:hypothetical protein